MPSDQAITDLTGLAVAVGRVEEKINGINSNRENDISFQQSVRDTFTDHEKRLTAVESGIKFMQWLVPIAVTIAVFGANWVSDILMK